jgi:phenylacetate-CoA ligase
MGNFLYSLPVSDRLVLQATLRLRRSNTMGVYREIREEPFVPAATVQARQWERLSRLLTHAVEKVPYYRQLFAERKMTPRDIRNFTDFAALPILTKDIVRDRWRDLVREDVDLNTLQPHFSGGSTGVPLRFFRSPGYMEYSDAGTWRNMAQCGWRPGEMMAFVWGGNDKLYAMKGWEFELRQWLRRQYLLDPFYSGPSDFDRWLGVVRRIRATVLFGYASTIARFAEHLEATGQAAPPMKGVFTTAEKLYPVQRAVIGRVFQAPVFDLYGSSEIQNIAAECPRGKMHINADFVHVETDGTGTAEIPPPLLLTSLQNYAMPFLRYRNEDCGALSTDTCDCGNHFPLMELRVARSSDNFRLPDGRVVHGEFFTHLMYGAEGVASFQFHQTAVDAFTLWIVPAPGGLAEGRQRAAREAVRQIQALCPSSQIDVQVKEIDAIPLSKAGKHRFTRSDVSLETSASREVG